MKEYLQRHDMQAKATPKVFFDKPVETLIEYKFDRHGAPWPHPVSGDVLQGIKKGKIPLTRDKKRPVDPMEE
jgi:hypothetical protein